VTFWTLLTGKMPFNGASTEIFAAICSTPPPLITAVRPDVPPVLSAIISKLLAKNPDERYRTPAGLKADLLICQSKLTEGWSGRKSSVELIPSFPIASQDKFSEFVLPNTLVRSSSSSPHLTSQILEADVSASHLFPSLSLSIVRSSDGTRDDPKRHPTSRLHPLPSLLWSTLPLPKLVRRFSDL
jgi:serine/threonine protein kinase